ncbi:MAG: arsenate reductase ArsC [Rhizobiales bacterium]|nr:arsenate reductase ArsC [Hyphomicrobiales bacterium]
MKNLLVLCTGNSARSILGEALINDMSNGRVKAYSAGSDPKGKVHSASIKLLDVKGIDTSLFRSKSWDEFSVSGAPKLDIVITVCDSAGSETCPVWIGAPVQAHWGIADPAVVDDAGQTQAFDLAYEQMHERISKLLSLSLESLSNDELKEALDLIGQQSTGATDMAKK